MIGDTLLQKISNSLTVTVYLELNKCHKYESFLNRRALKVYTTPEFEEIKNIWCESHLFVIVDLKNRIQKFI